MAFEELKQKVPTGEKCIQRSRQQQLPHEPSPDKWDLLECGNLVWKRGGPHSVKPFCRELPSQTEI